MKELIRDYSFADYIDKDWHHWKFERLIDAASKVEKIFDEAFSAVAYGGNVSKTPLLMDENVWKVLIQFPPAIWDNVIHWLFNTGMLEAAAERDRDPEHRLEAIDNHKDKLVIHSGKTQYIFHDIYTGLQEIFENLERPIKGHREMKLQPLHPKAMRISQFHPDDPGIKDVDFHDPQWKEKYKYGLHALDLTNPAWLSPEYIDALPDTDPRFAKAKGDPEKIQAIKNAMKGSPLHSLAGMSVIQLNSAETMYRAWREATGLGLLGNVPHEVEDPYHPDTMLKITQMRPGDIVRDWSGSNHIGKNDGKSNNIPGALGYKENGLMLPTIIRTIQYSKKEGDSDPVPQGPVPMPMPYLPPGKIVPAIHNLTDDQRKVLAERRLGRSIPNYELVKNDPKIKEASRFGGLDGLLSNLDIITEEQFNHMKQNSRSLFQWLHTHMGYSNDPYVKKASKRHHGIGKVETISLDYYTVGGFQPNYGKKEVEGFANMPQEEFIGAVKKYWPQLLKESYDQFMKFLNNVKIKQEFGAATDMLANTLEKISGDLIQVVTALNALNLNNPFKGIRDPEVGLLNVPENYDEVKHKDFRKSDVQNTCRDMCQAAFGDKPSRRAMQKGIYGVGQSYHAMAGKGKEGEDLAFEPEDPRSTMKKASDIEPGRGGSGIQDSPVGSWDTKRGFLQPETQPETDEAGEVKYPVARLTWFAPKTGLDLIDKKIIGYRDKILAGLGPEYAEAANRLKENYDKEVAQIGALYEEVLKELKAKSASGPQYASQKDLEDAAKNETLKRYKGAGGGREVLDMALAAQRKREFEEEEKKKAKPAHIRARDEAMTKFFDALLQKGNAPLPEWDEDERKWTTHNNRLVYLDNPAVQSSLKKFGTPARVVQFIQQIWDNDGAALYGVRLVKAVFKIGEEDAIEAVKKAGVRPQEAPEEKPETEPETNEPSAIAATDITGLFNDLANNYEQIIARKNEITKDKFDELSKAWKALKAKDDKTTKEIRAIVALSVNFPLQAPVAPKTTQPSITAQDLINPNSPYHYTKIKANPSIIADKKEEFKKALGDLSKSERTMEVLKALVQLMPLR